MSPATLVETLCADTPPVSESQGQGEFITVTRKGRRPATVGGKGGRTRHPTLTKESPAVRAASAEYPHRRHNLRSARGTEPGAPAEKGTPDVFSPPEPTGHTTIVLDDEAFPTLSEAVRRSRSSSPRAKSPRGTGSVRMAKTAPPEEAHPTSTMPSREAAPHPTLGRETEVRPPLRDTRP
jgi:hypothetical protein